MFDGLEGKVAVVTGAGRMRSIGRPIAVELARAGCNIVLTGTGRAPEDYPADEQKKGWQDITSVADEVREAGAEALELVSNVADPDAVDELVAKTLERFGRVDLVHDSNASLQFLEGDRSGDEDVIERVEQLNDLVADDIDGLVDAR